MRITPVRILRGLILTALAAVTAVILVDFINHARLRIKGRSVSGELAEQKIERTEKLQYSEVKKGKLRFRITAERHYMGEDGLYHLEGGVEILFPGRIEGRDVVFQGDEIVYGQEARLFRLTGHAVARFKDLTFRSSMLVYNSDSDILSSQKGVRFSSERLSGSAGRMETHIRKERLVLSKNIELQALMDWDPDLPLKITGGDRLEYWQKRGTGTIEGRVILDYGKSRAQADRLSFALFSDKERVRSLLLQGNVRTTLSIEDSPGGTPEAENGILNAEHRELSSDELSVINYRDAFQARRLQAKGGCRFRLVSGPRIVDIEADSMDAALNPKGEMRRFFGRKNVHLVESRGPEEGKREIHGDSLTLEGRGQTFEVTGTAALPALIKSEEFRINAGVIEMTLNRDDLRAAKGVSVVLESQGEDQTAAGIFSKDRPLFITAGEMRYIAAEERFLFKEKVKIWQEVNALEAGELVLFRNTGRLICRPPTRSVLALRLRREEAKETVAIRAESMEYKPRLFSITYQTKASLKVRDITLEADSLRVAMAEESGDIVTITASGGVIIRQGGYEGNGKTAVYIPSEETITLTGNPVLIDKTRGRTRGDKLTFHMSDGRISVENQDRKRSRTIIKSE